MLSSMVCGCSCRFHIRLMYKHTLCINFEIKVRVFAFNYTYGIFIYTCETSCFAFEVSVNEEGLREVSSEAFELYNNLQQLSWITATDE
jgi:hypothetical protein